LIQIDNPIPGLLWNDTMDVYRPSSTNPLKAVLAVVTGVRCRKIDTDNYDEDSSFVGQSKQNNIDTADKVHFDPSVDVRSEDFLFVTKADGEEGWFQVAGAPKRRTGLLSYARVNVTTTTPPKVVAGTWSDS
jgi:hypothetical protein